MATLAQCRDQQAYHRDRADMATLENVRAISTKAVLAWGREAVRAEQREQRRVHAEAIAHTAATDEPDACEADERPFSENPDRGFAAP